MSKNIFNTVRVRKPNTNHFNLSHDVKLSANMGQLVPILVQEAIPGDKFRCSANALVRFAPLLAPIMHNVNAHVHWFFVPNRIVWKNWESFMSPPTEDSTLPAWPHWQVSNNVIPEGSVGDYMGLPINQQNLGGVSAIPFAGYAKIWNEYYRDQNLQTAYNTDLEDGSQTNPAGDKLEPHDTVLYRSWQHDYFTGSLPFTQKGAPVNIPLSIDGGYAQVVTRGNETDVDLSVNDWTAENSVSGGTSLARARVDTQVPFGTGSFAADLSTTTFQNSGTINDLRLAMRAQEWLEKQARGGSRYIEQIRMHFAVHSSDKRLQRPEYIGGISSPIVFSEVLQTSAIDGQPTPQGNMAGHGIGATGGKSYTYFAEEHGYVFGILSVTPRTAYQQGIPRHFNRRDPFDYAWPTFAHIGEQEVLNREIYAAADGQNDEVFGYVPRYAEYRYTPSRVAGAFRTTLAFWHLGRIFDNRPHLNEEFITCNPRLDIFAAAGEQGHLWIHVNNRVKVRRALPKYGTPTL